MEVCGWQEGSVGGTNEEIVRTGRQTTFASSLNIVLKNGGGKGRGRKDEPICEDDWAR